MDIQLKEFNSKKLLKNQRDLFTECFPETIGSSIIKKSHYFWKFHSFPSKIKSYEYGAFNDDELIGYYAALPYRYRINNKEVNVGMVCDVMTGVKARGKGVFTKIGAYSTNSLKGENISFTTGYPIRKEVIPGHLKVGWELMHSLPLYVKFISVKSLFRSKKIGFFSFFADLILTFYNFIITIFNSRNKYDIKNYSNSEISKIYGLDIFLEEWGSQQKIALKKDINFLNWRLGAPKKKYTISVFSIKEKIVGYAVFCDVIKENIPSIAILDISVLKEYQGLSNFIFKHIETLAKQNKKESIIMMCSKHLYNILRMKKSGFIKTPYIFSLIVKNLSNEFSDEFLKNEKNWHLSWIDSDNL